MSKWKSIVEWNDRIPSVATSEYCEPSKNISTQT